MQFMGYDEKKLAQIVDEWERKKWDNKMLAAKETYKPKHIITRSEAIALIKQHLPKIFDAASVIDFYVAAGMLEIKEELPGLPIGFEFPFSKRDEWTNCCNEMFKQGYKISK